jgi:hypothetical protein
MELDKIPLQMPDFIIEPLEGELLLYHLNEQKVLYLNQTAFLIWQLIDGKRSVGEILDLLSAAYPESTGQIAVDLDDTLQSFQENGCIQIS